jgi:branched-chain amino acid transport system permease protein
MASFFGIVFDGVAYGSLLFLISIGLSVTMGLMNIVNLAHGAFAMFGGYLSVWLGARGLPFVATLPVCFVSLGLAGGASGSSISACAGAASSTRCCSASD